MSPAAISPPKPAVERKNSPSSSNLVTLAREQVRRGNANYHSTSLRTLLSNGVNKTALHPGGVQ